jgi:hypothetical protein
VFFVKDILVIAIVLGFFAVCVAYVVWCERILAGDAADRTDADVQTSSLVGSEDASARVG